MRTLGYLSAAVLFALLTSVNAFAASVAYEIGDDSAVASYGPPSPFGLDIRTFVLPGFAGSTFSLEDNMSETLPFFGIWTPEEHAGGDDLIPRTIEAVIDFDLPQDTLVVVDGYTYAELNAIPFLGFARGNGQVVWEDSVQVITSQATFEVSLNNAEFSEGTAALFDFEFDLNPHPLAGAIIYATVTQVSSGNGETPVIPMPTAAAGGLVFAGLCLFRRNRRR